MWCDYLYQFYLQLLFPHLVNCSLYKLRLTNQLRSHHPILYKFLLFQIFYQYIWWYLNILEYTFYLIENINCEPIGKNFQERIRFFLFLHYKLSLFLVMFLYHQSLLLYCLNLQLFLLLFHLFFALWLTCIFVLFCQYDLSLIHIWRCRRAD